MEPLEGHRPSGGSYIEGYGSCFILSVCQDLPCGGFYTVPKETPESFFHYEGWGVFKSKEILAAQLRKTGRSMPLFAKSISYAKQILFIKISPIILFMKYILYLFSSLCYNDTVAPPILAQEGGVSYGRFFHHFYYLCYGRCGLPPHLQMAGQR